MSRNGIGGHLHIPMDDSLALLRVAGVSLGSIDNRYLGLFRVHSWVGFYHCLYEGDM